MKEMNDMNDMNDMSATHIIDTMDTMNVNPISCLHNITIFNDLTRTCSNYGWKLNINLYDLCYSNGKDNICIRFYPSNISVSVPIRNSDKNYCSEFNNFVDACEFALNSFNYFVD